MTTPFTCPFCGLTSHHPQDAAQRYCGNCHRFVGDSMTIFKIQRPLDDPNGEWLAYSEGHKNMTIIPGSRVPQALRDALADYPKGYFEAEIQGANLVVNAQVADQDW